VTAPTRIDGRREWEPEAHVTVDVARRTVADQFPELAALPVRWFDAGWDNAVVAVGDHLVFRFVHRAIALDGSRRELVVLRELVDGLPCPVPRPQYVGTPTTEVPWPFWGGPMLHGSPLAAGGRLPGPAPVATQLGAFLRALHDPVRATRAAATGALPTDPMGRGDGERVVERARAAVGRLRDAGALPTTGERARRLDALLTATEESVPADPGDQVLVHGDLHARHVLMAGQGASARVSGVLDWGDTCLADPSVDLMIAWAAFEGATRDTFLAAYGSVPAGRALRARALAVRVGGALAEQALADGLDDLATAALGTIERATR
jgi:aminoglycoside phosphotransferase (APT) family kinase protein